MLQQMNKVLYTHNISMCGKSIPFYVGIGSNSRAHYLRRNPYHSNVVAKYGAHSVQVKIWEDSLTMADAAIKEVELIAFLKESGIRLTNLTRGGDGTFGYKWTASQRLKKSRENHHMYGKHQSSESNKKRSLTLRGVWKTKIHPFIGKVEEPGAKTFRIQRIRESWTLEKRNLQSIFMSGTGNPFFGKKHSDESKAIMSAKRIGKTFRSKESYEIAGAKVKAQSRRWVTNGITSKQLSEPTLSEYISIGWKFGKMDKRGAK